MPPEEPLKQYVPPPEPLSKRVQSALAALFTLAGVVMLGLAFVASIFNNIDPAITTVMQQQVKALWSIERFLFAGSLLLIAVLIQLSRLLDK